MIRSSPLTAPRLRGMCRLPKPDRESVITSLLKQLDTGGVERVLSTHCAGDITRAASAGATLAHHGAMHHGTAEPRGRPANRGAKPEGFPRLPRTRLASHAHSPRFMRPAISGLATT